MIRAQSDPLEPVRRMVWLYFWLLLFEGVLRKWVFPGWSDALFLIRDPVAVMAYMLALRAGVFPLRPAILAVGVLAVLAFLFTLTTDTPYAVVLFGLRTDFLHLPLIFVIGAVMDRADVIRMGRWVLIASVPILFLMMRQFDAAPDDPINAGAGGNLSGQLHGALGKIRPPGPFSFITGAVLYFSMVAAFVIHGWLEPKSYSRLWVVLGTATVIAAIPVSISRAMLLAVMIVAAFGVAVIVTDPRKAPRMMGPMVFGGCFLVFAADSIYVQAFLTRWDEAAAVGSGSAYNSIADRILTILTEPFSIAAKVPILGHGIGVGTLAGSRLMTGRFEFALSESELARIIMELGPLLGFCFLLWRVWLTISLMAAGWSTARLDGNVLPWLLTGACFANVLNGQWGQATELGFATLGAGLALAAQNTAPESSTTEEESALEVAEATDPP